MTDTTTAFSHAEREHLRELICFANELSFKALVDGDEVAASLATDFAADFEWMLAIGKEIPASAILTADIAGAFHAEAG